MQRTYLAASVIAAAHLIGAQSAMAFNEPYCGLYGMHAALNAIGIESSVEEMIVPENLSGVHGSTVEDLLRLARDAGAEARYRYGLSLASLHRSESPLLLHTSVPTAKGVFQHWVVYLGMEGESVRLYDPPSQVYTVTPGELLSFWDGRAVEVSGSSLSTAPAIPTEFLLAFLFVGSAVAVSGSLSEKRGAGLLFWIGVILLPCLAWHGAVDYGFLRGRLGQDIVAGRHSLHDVEVIDAERFTRCREAQDAVLIDARTPEDYARGRIDDAINLPMSCTYGQLRDTLAAYDRDQLMVIYCLSDRCRWSDEIAQLIASRGFENIRVYRGGYIEWRDSRGSPSNPG